MFMQIVQIVQARFSPCFRKRSALSPYPKNPVCPLHDEICTMGSARWNPHNIICTIEFAPLMESTQRNPHIGTRKIDPIHGIYMMKSERWNMHDRIHTMEFARWNPHLIDAVQSMLSHRCSLVNAFSVDAFQSRHSSQGTPVRALQSKHCSRTQHPSTAHE